ncbi:hypothetical protein MAPG_01494 [Magnaporthiopsis poae ATCC 64411]|uniref:Uncharacterized protein n=1 Tax=Magnaporthiopsis poae (strain ATCC 64411 / 73-15) TaxID=644358 RepID=A0A0C4DNU7_MAGP6|nr:hypothetical protein MAPG_01494 [Magnaporthiopsis poae ATCC 64411]
MKCFSLFATLLPSLALALPANLPRHQSQAIKAAGDCAGGIGNGDQGTGPCTNQGNGQGTGQGIGEDTSPDSNRTVITAQQQFDAVNAWRADTGKVSRFLDTATLFTGQEYTRMAQMALDAELDELAQKEILDQAMGTRPEIQAASDVLSNQGYAKDVVDALRAMIKNGPETAVRDVEAINRNRCVNVLPNIDAYFAAAGEVELWAIRPVACDQVLGAPGDDDDDDDEEDEDDLPQLPLPDVTLFPADGSMWASKGKPAGGQTAKIRRAAAV